MRIYGGVVAAAALLGAAACGGSGNGNGSVAPAFSVTISLEKGGPSPANASVYTSGRVGFIDVDSTAHKIVSKDCTELDTPDIQPHQNYVATVTQPGNCTYAYGDNAGATGTMAITAQ